ncbi:MAG: transposon-encoded TnpW family protein [Oscillospiraceae bacterium]|nr:transposon-encoded TnpW family protein [Oscillospiraceae bacterium]
MSDKTPQKATGTAQRAPDCVTEVRMGNTILTVSGYFKESATETAADKMARAIKAEVASEHHSFKSA